MPIGLHWFVCNVCNGWILLLLIRDMVLMMITASKNEGKKYLNSLWVLYD